MEIAEAKRRMHLTIFPTPTPTTKPTPTTFSPLTPIPTSLLPPPPIINDTTNLRPISSFELSIEYDPFTDFGGSVAIDKDIMVVGASGYNNRTGGVFVYRKQQQQQQNGTWIKVQDIAPADGRPGDGFGKSVAIDGGNRIVVGAPFCDPDKEHYQYYNSHSSGCVYVYNHHAVALLSDTNDTNDTNDNHTDGSSHLGWWKQEIKLTSTEIDSRENFGFTVAIEDDSVILVGAPKYDSSSGRVFVFRLEQHEWKLEQILYENDARVHSLFGYSVAMNSGRIVVGAVQGSTIGAACVFTRSEEEGNRFALQQRILPSDAGKRRGWFGRSVAIYRDTIVVGRVHTEGYNAQLGGDFGGGAYVFSMKNRSFWEEEQILRIRDNENDDFGTSVAIQGDTILVGAVNADSVDVCYNDNDYFYPPLKVNTTICHHSRGSVYAFVRSDNQTWSMQQQLSGAPGPTAGYKYGFSVAIQDNTVVVGIPRTGYGTGRVIVYETDE